jgi:hypothetical protein
MWSASRVSPGEDLAGEGAGGPFGDDHVGAVGQRGGALGADGEHVLLDGQVDGPGGDPGQVQADVEVVALAPGVHRHRGGAGGGAEHLLGEPVQLAERVGAQRQGMGRSRWPQVQRLTLPAGNVRYGLIVARTTEPPKRYDVTVTAARCSGLHVPHHSVTMHLCPDSHRYMFTARAKG